MVQSGISANSSITFFAEFLSYATFFFCFSATSILDNFKKNNYKNLPFKQLLALCVEKAENWEMAWTEFQSRYDSLISRYVYNEYRKWCKDGKVSPEHSQIKDLCQDVYINLLKNDAKAIDDFNRPTEGYFLSYLNTIAKNLVRNHFKKAQQQRQIPMVGVASPQTNGEEERVIYFEPATSDTEEEIRYALVKDELLTTLSKHWKSRHHNRDIFIFVLFYFENFTASDIAKNFDIELGVSGIETLISRMRTFLRERLGKKI